MTWHSSFEQEIESAQSARACGNEGQARVCARRAAGIVLRQYYHQSPIPSAYDLLQKLLLDAASPLEARQAAQALTMRVSEQFSLPLEVDLIQQARKLAKALFPRYCWRTCDGAVISLPE